MRTMSRVLCEVMYSTLANRISCGVWCFSYQYGNGHENQCDADKCCLRHWQSPNGQWPSKVPTPSKECNERDESCSQRQIGMPQSEDGCDRIYQQQKETDVAFHSSFRQPRASSKH